VTWTLPSGAVPTQYFKADTAGTLSPCAFDDQAGETGNVPNPVGSNQSGTSAAKNLDARMKPTPGIMAPY
jgi:hypothetical protein